MRIFKPLTGTGLPVQGARGRVGEVSIARRDGAARSQAHQSVQAAFHVSHPLGPFIRPPLLQVLSEVLPALPAGPRPLLPK